MPRQRWRFSRRFSPTGHIFPKTCWSARRSESSTRGSFFTGMTPKRRQAADRFLESFIWDYENSTLLELVFAKLDRSCASKRSARRECKMGARAGGASPPHWRALRARLQVRERKTRKPRDQRALRAGISTHPLLPQVASNASGARRAAASFRGCSCVPWMAAARRDNGR